MMATPDLPKVPPGTETYAVDVASLPGAPGNEARVDDDVDATQLQMTSDGMIAEPVLGIRMLVSSRDVGSIIGKGGMTIKTFRRQSGARINISNTSTTCSERLVTVTGNRENVSKAFAAIGKKIQQDMAASKQQEGQTESSDALPSVSFRLVIQTSQCGSLIGKGGSKIKEIRESTGASIQVAGETLPNSTERTVTISGSPDALTLCVSQICNIMLENPTRGRFIPYKPHTLPNRAYEPYVLPNLFYQPRVNLAKFMYPPLNNDGVCTDYCVITTPSRFRFSNQSTGSSFDKPAPKTWDAQLDMMKEMGAESLHRIEAKLKMPGKIAGRLKKKIVSELVELRKALVAGFTQAKEAIQSMFTSKAPCNSSSGHAAIKKHFDELWGAISNLGMLELTTKAFSKGLITAEVKSKVFSTNGLSSEVKADALLSAIQERIKTDPSAFDVFVEILRSESAYEHLADKLTSDCSY